MCAGPWSIYRVFEKALPRSTDVSIVIEKDSSLNSEVYAMPWGRVSNTIVTSLKEENEEGGECEYTTLVGNSIFTLR